MSAAVALCRELDELGVLIWEECGQLRYRAPAGALSPELLARIRDFKAEILLSQHLASCVSCQGAKDGHCDTAAMLEAACEAKRIQVWH